MSFAGSPFAGSTFAGVAGAGLAPPPPDTGVPPPTLVMPFTVEIDGMAIDIRASSMRLDAQLGRQGEAQFQLKSLAVMPAIGQPVKIKYFSHVLFAGQIDHVDVVTEPSQSFTVIDCTCTDHSYLLMRQKIKRNFTNKTLRQIATTLADSELLADGVTVGTVDVSTSIPVADADWVSIHQFLSELATAVGAMFYIDYDKKMHFISTSVTPSGTPLTAVNIEQCKLSFDRETYRNKQTTTVTGTPAVEGQTALTVELTRSNSEQIVDRYNVEHTGGIYNDHVRVTHPSSNDAAELTRLAQAYNKIGLAVSGSIQRSISIKTRQYGYQVGQFVSVTLDYLGISGAWVVQRLQLQEENGLFVVSTMELSQASLRLRQQELWLDAVGKGTVAILPPSAVYTHAFSAITPGIGSWQVPVGVTEVQVTVVGGGAGGGGGAKSEWPGYGGINTADGARGGSGGVSITIMSVTPGEVLTYWVGAAGVGGAGQYRFESFTDAVGVNGTDGIASWVERSGGFRVGQGNGGQGGLGGLANARLQRSITYPAGQDGTGLYGHVVTVGGAANYGAGGLGFNNGAGANGTNGRVVIEW